MTGSCRSSRTSRGSTSGPSPPGGGQWYNNLIGYQLNQLQSSDKPLTVENVPLAYQPQPIAIGQFTGPIAMERHSCFAAGTLVRTLTGLEPIETLKLGDPVLTQSTQDRRPGLQAHPRHPPQPAQQDVSGQAR